MEIEKEVYSVLGMITYIYATETNIYTDIKDKEEGIRIETYDGQIQSVSHFIPYNKMLEFLKILLKVDSYSYKTGYEDYYEDDSFDFKEVHIIDQFKIDLLEKLEETVFVDEMIGLIPDIQIAINESGNSIFKDKLALFVNHLKKKTQSNEDWKTILKNQEELKNYLKGLASNSFWLILVCEFLSYLLGFIGNLISNLIQGDYLFAIDYRIILLIGSLSSLIIPFLIALLIYKNGLKRSKKQIKK